MEPEAPTIAKTSRAGFDAGVADPKSEAGLPAENQKTGRAARPPAAASGRSTSLRRSDGGAGGSDHREDEPGRI